ncbi:hypothetical protein [Shouchella clausii]|uniref:Uncharacterized protein n=1 Tax=Shouchella clausii TaxID=79880 RepID=A0A268S3E6_SHOCL|nr:hypothetical protein [Shouchella clausii]PAD42853.1 hypothetical protein CHH54_09860 [Bacillus sp. 7520-S]SPU22346.1 YhzB [Niallia circulans]AST98304.1 hypothetical protein BC8716_21110 [Shouchella clausii]MBU8595137.1 hypothetical protein [Shouchella clausii]MCR1289069.1 hypothetical protein [Shouchella clausii]
MTIGLLYTYHIEIGPSSQMLKGRLQFFQELLHFDLQDAPLNTFVARENWPQKGTLHHEALFASLQEGDFFKPVHSAVDVTRFFMLEYKLPITFHDADALTTPLMVDPKQATVSDQLGLISSPDTFALRTEASETTTNGLHVFYFPNHLHEDKRLPLLQAAGNMFTHVHGGNTSIQLMESSSSDV